MYFSNQHVANFSREGVNLALQSLKDDGELQKLINKWFKRADCDPMFDQVMLFTCYLQSIYLQT